MSITASLNFNAIGTSWQIDFLENISALKLESLKLQILTKAEEFDKIFSRFRSDSWINKVYLNPGTHKLPPQAFKLLKLNQSFYKITQGNFTPCIGQSLVETGYDADYSLIPKQVTPPPNFLQLKFNSKTLTTSEPILLDFGATGKGYLIDILTQIISKAGIVEYWVDGSGDIYNHSSQTMKIGLENPDDLSQIIAIANLKPNFSLCASAGNRRRWKNYHHILNPKTLTSPKHVLGTWVIAKTAHLADALATALFLTSPATLAQNFKFEYCLLTSQHQLLNSVKFPFEVN